MREEIKRRMLIVDDAAGNRELLRDIFQDQYEIIEACDGEEAIRALDLGFEELEVVFLDVFMPKKSGIEVLEHMNEKGYIRYVPVILITGDDSAEVEEQAFDLGVIDIVHKPYSSRIIRRRTMNVIQLFQNRMHLENKLEARTRELRKNTVKLQKNTDFLISALSSVVEYRNRESVDHSGRVKYFTRVLMEDLKKNEPQLKLTDEMIEEIVKASTLHDIGKISVPDNVLLKCGTLTEDDWETIRRHTTDGCALLEHFKQEENSFYHYCYDICKSHHERYDGSGYPEGLKGDEIPLWAEVVGIADAFEELCGQRTYKPAIKLDVATQMVLDGQCGAFRPMVLESFKRCSRTLGDAVMRGVPTE